MNEIEETDMKELIGQNKEILAKMDEIILLLNKIKSKRNKFLHHLLDPPGLSLPGQRQVVVLDLVPLAAQPVRAFPFQGTLADNLQDL